MRRVLSVLILIPVVAAHFFGKGSSPLSFLVPSSKISSAFMHLGSFPGPSLCSIHLCVVFVPIIHCFECCNFVILSEVWELCLLLFSLRTGNSVSFIIPYKFLDYFSSSMKNVMGILIGFALNL